MIRNRSIHDPKEGSDEAGAPHQFRDSGASRGTRSLPYSPQTNMAMRAFGFQIGHGQSAASSTIIRPLPHLRGGYHMQDVVQDTAPESEKVRGSECRESKLGALR